MESILQLEASSHSSSVLTSPGARERRHERLDDPAVLFRRRSALACPASPVRIPDTDMDGDRGGCRSGTISSKPQREAQRIWGVDGRIC
ncbi:hypothetical protein CCMA1212_001010 [Trichoderma ghanense]|uniref:Uncharacterized protein n=1 Tax=Trichoderma ghanense TaxID=65468 RepID=A0ABY2HDW4_9HYPO